METVWDVSFVDTFLMVTDERRLDDFQTSFQNRTTCRLCSTADEQ
jgi:hypothetical protein